MLAGVEEYGPALEHIVTWRTAVAAQGEPDALLAHVADSNTLQAKYFESFGNRLCKKPALALGSSALRAAVERRRYADLLITEVQSLGSVLVHGASVTCCRAIPPDSTGHVEYPLKILPDAEAGRQAAGALRELSPGEKLGLFKAAVTLAGVHLDASETVLAALAMQDLFELAEDFTGQRDVARKVIANSSVMLRTLAQEQEIAENHVDMTRKLARYVLDYVSYKLRHNADTKKYRFRAVKDSYIETREAWGVLSLREAEFVPALENAAGVGAEQPLAQELENRTEVYEQTRRRWGVVDKDRLKKASAKLEAIQPRRNLEKYSRDEQKNLTPVAVSLMIYFVNRTRQMLWKAYEEGWPDAPGYWHELLQGDVTEEWSYAGWLQELAGWSHAQEVAARYANAYSLTDVIDLTREHFDAVCQAFLDARPRDKELPAELDDVRRVLHGPEQAPEQAETDERTSSRPRVRVARLKRYQIVRDLVANLYESAGLMSEFLPADPREATEIVRAGGADSSSAESPHKATSPAMKHYKFPVNPERVALMYALWELSDFRKPHAQEVFGTGSVSFPYVLWEIMGPEDLVITAAVKPLDGNAFYLHEWRRGSKIPDGRTLFTSVTRTPAQRNPHVRRVEQTGKATDIGKHVLQIQAELAELGLPKGQVERLFILYKKYCYALRVVRGQDEGLII